MVNFFISYNKADKHWAEGLGNWLDQALFTTILQEQDFVAGSNFVSQMHGALKEAERLILVLSPDYLSSKFAESEWTAAFVSDPTNLKSTLVPVRVRDCQPDGLLKPLVYIDLVNLSPEQAHTKFISEIKAATKGKRTTNSTNATAPAQAHSGSVSQAISGDNNVQVAGDLHHYAKPSRPKIIITPPPGAVSASELRQIDLWIESLAENTINKPRSTAFGMWRNRFKNHFNLTRSEQLMSAQMPDVEAWYRQQMAIQKRGWKTKAPDQWRKARCTAIHMALNQMGVDKLTYYGELSSRLRMKSTFTTITSLTKKDLERVYNMVLADARSR